MKDENERKRYLKFEIFEIIFIIVMITVLIIESKYVDRIQKNTDEFNNMIERMEKLKRRK